MVSFLTYIENCVERPKRGEQSLKISFHIFRKYILLLTAGLLSNNDCDYTSKLLSASVTITVLLYHWTYIFIDSNCANMSALLRGMLFLSCSLGKYNSLVDRVVIFHKNTVNTRGLSKKTAALHPPAPG